MNIILILTGIAIIKFMVLGFIAYKIFWPMWRDERTPRVLPGVPCVYCKASPSTQLSEEQRWEGDELVMVRGYHCPSCEMPFWHVERVSATPAQTP